ncbi:MAG: family 78 glycoside hydrolase catalytic domain [Clostridia bacterium]|nr:family 78 glycoside hydrolase catalytic domain [Clostridia bacterium]
MQIKINSLVTPFIDTAPRFSWSLSPFAEQVAYTLTVSADAGFENPVFSVREETDERANIRHDMALMPHTKYFVSVCAELENGKKCEGTTHFCTGFMGGEWDAKYITGGKARRRDAVLPAVYLRREFTAKKPLRAVLYVVGLGYFEAHINGEKAHDDFLCTPFTSYDKNILYRAFDVTEMIAEGENAIGVILGNGFYNCFTDDPWQTKTAPWRDVPKLMLELHMEYEHGTEKLLSDGTWSWVDGPIRFNGIRHGEEYDANFEKEGWDKPGYTGEAKPARYVRAPGALLSLMEMEPIRVIAKYKPVLCRKTKEGYLYELAQNIAGVAHITFRGKAGARYTVRYTDRLMEDGEPDHESLACFIHNYCFQTDVYTKKSDEPESFHAIFTYHGFQYIEVSGGDCPELCDIEAWALCNDFEKRAHFTCSDETVNKIEHLCHASTVSCCMHTLSADAVREKSSWTGDTGLSAEQLLINYNAENLMRKWQQDLRDSMRPGGCMPCIVPSAGWGYSGDLNGPDWCNPMVDVPWTLYTEYGDIEVLRDNYEALCAHVSYINSMSYGYIAEYGLGDWCAPFDGPAISVNMSAYKCPLAVSDTAFYHSAVKMAERYARLLGFDADAEKYAALAEKVKAAFREKFFDAENFTVHGDCQSATAMMVYHGLANEDEIPHLVEALARQVEREGYHPDFGILGCKAVVETLGRYGRADLVIKMLTNPTYPSMKVWLDMGATTLFECWNGGGSRNQHMFSSVSAFFHKYVAGLSAAAPGYREIDFRPALYTELTHASASVNTPYGKAACGFEKNGGKTMVYLTVPAGCLGKLYVGETMREFAAGEYAVEV